MNEIVNENSLRIKAYLDEKNISSDVHNALIKKVKQYISENSISQASFAKKVGIGESTFSRWLSGTLENTTNQDSIIYSFIDKEEGRKKILTANHMKYIETSISKRILGVLEYSSITRCIGVIYGDAGVGKTTTIKEWSKNRRDAVVIKANKAIASRNKGLLKTLAVHLRTQTYGQFDDIYFSMTEKLKNEDKIIIVDEAQHLSLSNIELLMDIYDDTETAIVLVGNERLYSKIAVDKSKDYAQIYSRIGVKEHVLTDDTTFEDVKNICSGLTEEGIEFLYAIAKNAGGLRSAVIIYVNASNRGDLSIEGLKAIASYSGKNV